MCRIRCIMFAKGCVLQKHKVKIRCSSCNGKYLGQTPVQIQIRFWEHCRYIKTNNPQSCFNYQINAQLFYSIIYVLHYSPRHVSSNNMLIFRRSILYCYSIWYRHSVSGRTVHRLRADCSLLSTGALYGRLQKMTIPNAVAIQFWPPEDEHSIARNMSSIIV
jgi:hypothetical protein